ncbi:acetylornithine deacetylase [Robbsia andropogonis]|uniref:acetylornithine deacetylase n=1 Tax=Robbsia andropogonis TaxID=28092 RepID=UPI003D20B84F
MTTLSSESLASPRSGSATDVLTGTNGSPARAGADGATNSAAVHRPASLEWVERLVRFDTTSRESNLGLIETIPDAVQRITGKAPVLTYDRTGKKANLFATVAAASGELDGGIVLSGHTDVVPVDGQQWQSNPFEPEIRDGLLYGRGTADMKGFIGTVMAQLPNFAAKPLRQPIHLSLTYDEEVGCLGAPVLLADLAARGVKPSGCIVGEPTEMRVVVAHKGINTFRCHVHGHAAHSSLTPRGANAIEHAARLICFIRDMVDEFRAKGPFDADFDVPFSTEQTSLIKGGNAINTVPADCEFQFEYRNLPGVDAAGIEARIRAYIQTELLPRMRRDHPAAAIELIRTAGAPALDAAEQAAVTTLVRALARDTETRKVAYATEGGQFAQAGIPTVICGPGNIQQAHRADEYVALEQIVACESFLDKLMRSLLV